MFLQECVRGALKNKTVVLVTHQVDFLHNADIIYVSTTLHTRNNIQIVDTVCVACSLYNEMKLIKCPQIYVCR